MSPLDTRLAKRVKGRSEATLEAFGQAKHTCHQALQAQGAAKMIPDKTTVKSA
jgi:hypothetical protein